MKYYTHMVFAHQDTMIQEAMLKFGMDGYGVWFITAEMIAHEAKVTPSGDIFFRIQTDPRTIEKATNLRIDRLETIYEWYMEKTKRKEKGKRFRFRIVKDTWVIEMPNLLAFMDDHTERTLRETRESLRSDSGATPGGGGRGPFKGYKGVVVGKGGGGGGGEGGAGEAPADEDEVSWFKRVMPAWEDLCSAPGERTKRNHIRDWLRQGVQRRAIEEAPANPEFGKFDFFKIGQELKRRATSGNGNGTGGGMPGYQRPKAAPGHFAVPAGKSDDEVQRRIQERERREAEERDSGGVVAQGQKDRGSAPPQGDVPPGPA